MKHLKYIIVYLLGIVLTSYFTIELSFMFDATAFLGLFMIMLFLCGIVLITIYIFKKDKKLFFHGCCALGSFIMIIAISNLVEGKQTEASKKKATTVIEALNRYKRENGCYPTNLSDVKNITTKDLNTRMGIFITHHYRYGKYDGLDEYYLSFPAPAWCIASYSSKTKTWVIND